LQLSSLGWIVVKSGSRILSRLWLPIAYGNLMSHSVLDKSVVIGTDEELIVIFDVPGLEEY